MSEEKFCASVWHHMNINNRGQVKPCCIFRDGKIPNDNENIFDWYETAYNDVKSQGLEHKGCELCYKQEQNNIPSRRTWRGNKEHIPKSNKGINYIDLSFGNYCNLKCRMCESRNSTKWIADEKYLEKNNFDIEREIFSLYTMSDERLDQIVNYCNSIDTDSFMLEIKGGEPFVTDQFYNFIHRLNDRFKSICKIVVFTNGSGINEEYIDSLKGFKELKIHLSVEGTGKLYEYIRGGNIVTLDTAISNIGKIIKSVPNTLFSASITVTMYNIFQLKDLHDRILKEMPKIKEIDPKLFASFSYNPRYLNPGILPDKYKNKIKELYADMPAFDHMIKTLEYFEKSN